MEPSFSLAFFPYLKTTDEVHYKSLTFKSNRDTENLNEETKRHVEILSKLFFLRDNLQIQSTVYAILPHKNKDISDESLRHLQEFQILITYLYSSPHKISGDPFLSTEHMSVFVFTPKPVSIYLFKETDNVIDVTLTQYPETNHREEIDGYEIVLNFKTHLWAIEGGRIYPPTGRLWLNISQNLFFDISHLETGDYSNSLIRFLEADTKMPHLYKRILTSLTWYNRSILKDIEEEVALVNLAVAFESLLDLETGEQVTNRFREAVKLLVGGLPRIDSWLIQFYNARSQILHEGYTSKLQFLAIDDPYKKSKDPAQVYNSLVSYGRLIFRLCLSTILNGALMAEDLGLSAKFYTNQQRLEHICKVLEDTEGTAQDKLLAAASDVEAIELYRFLPETGLRLDTLIGTTKRFTQRYLETASTIEEEFAILLRDFSQSQKGSDYFEPLSKLRAIQDYKKTWGDNKSPNASLQLVISLLDSAWHYTFMHYFWLFENRPQTEGSN